MNITLNTPKQENSPPTEIDIRTSALQSWIEALPLMDYARSCEKVTNALHHINRHQLDVKARIEAVTLLSERVEKLHKIVPRSFDSDALPFTEKQLASKQGPQRLLAECAISHKIIINELLADPKLLAKHKQVLFYSLVKALHYMSLELIERFLIYRIPAEGTWQDIHKLYVIAGKMSVLDISISGSAAQGEASTSINELYKKILLLSLADLSRLMMGEATSVYKQLAEWSKLTSLLALDDAFREGVVVDLGIDAPASHILSKQTLKFHNGRVFDISHLLVYLDEQVDVMTEQGQSGGNMLSVRARQAMYIRLRRTWGSRGEREAGREPIKTPMKLISGLHDCHRVLSDDAPFNPEYDELHFEYESKKTVAGGLEGLALVPEGDSPWEREEMESRAAANIKGNRTSQFDDSTKADAWEKIYANKLAEVERQKRESTPLIATDCFQVDISPGGMAIVCDKAQANAALAVGKVVTIRASNDDASWQAGIVRWLVMLPNNDIRCGVQVLSEHAVTIATKGVKGVGNNGEYYRSIMTLADEGSVASVFVPASVYSVNSIINAVVGGGVKYLALKSLLNNSASYNQFSFEEVSKPVVGGLIKAKLG